MEFQIAGNLRNRGSQNQNWIKNIDLVGESYFVGGHRPHLLNSKKKTMKTDVDDSSRAWTDFRDLKALQQNRVNISRVSAFESMEAFDHVNELRRQNMELRKRLEKYERKDARQMNRIRQMNLSKRSPSRQNLKMSTGHKDLLNYIKTLSK